MELPIIDRFRILKLIGTGGMGTVYEAYDTRRDLPIALKTLHRCDLAGIASLKREFRAAAQLVHPHLVQLHELVVEGERCFFTMELVVGSRLTEWVRATATATSPGSEPIASASASGQTDLAPTELVSIPTRQGKRAAPPPSRAAPAAFDEQRLRRALAQLASALAFLHANGKAHRDIKPSNVLVDREGNVKLVDFGLVLELVRPEGRDEQLIAGTLPYMAPECLRAGGGSAEADLYSLGALAYELVTGRVPYSGASLEQLRRQHERPRPRRARAINPAVPRDLDELISALLDEVPSRRPRAVDVEERLAGRSSQAGARPAPFVDRSADLAALERALAAARSGVPRLVLTGSASGLGKSALVRHFVAAAPKGTVVYRGRCYEREQVAYRAFDRIIEDLAADLLHTPASARPPLHSHALERVFPAFGQLALADDAAAALDPLSERERGFTAFAELLHQQLSGTVGLFVVEDLQWTDAASLELLGCLLDHPGELPLLVVATYRPEDANRPLAEFIAARRGRPEVLELGLEPLSDRDVQRLTAALGAGALAGEIAARSKGNPYVVEALAREAAGHAASGLDVERLEERRLDRLGSIDRGVLEAVAIAGRPITFALLRAIDPWVEPTQLDESLRRLEAERLLRVAPADLEIGYDVYHDRIGRAARAQMSATRSRAVHGAFAAALERAEAPSLHHHERMAHHLASAGRPDEAAPHAFAAADAAMDKLAFEHAADFYSRALSLGLAAAAAHQAEERLALARLAAGDYGNAAPVCRSLAVSRGDDAWLLRAAEAEIKLGDLDSGVATLESLLRRHGLCFRSPFGHVASLMSSALLSARLLASRERGHDDSPASAHLAELFRVASHFLSTPYPIEAWEYVLRSLALARRRGDARGEACALAMVAAYLELATLRPVAEGPLAEAERIAGSDGYAGVVTAACRLICAAMRGDWTVMRAAAMRGETLCAELGIERSWEASFLTTYAGSGELSAGNGERAAQLFRRLLAGRGCDLFTRTIARAQYGRALLLGGAVDDAAQIARELHDAPAMANPAARFWLDLLDGEIDIARGDWAGAAALMAEAERRLRVGGLARLRVFSAFLAVVRATAALGLAQRGPQLARWAAREAAALQRLVRGTYLEATGYRLLGQARALAGEQALADDAFVHADGCARERGGRLERVVVAALLGRASPPEDLAAAVRWATAGAVTPTRH